MKIYDHRRASIESVLLKEGKITEEQLNEALEVQKKSPRPIGETLLELKYISEYDLTSVMSKQLGIPIATEESLMLIDQDAVSLIPEPFATEHRVIALKKEGNLLTVAMTDTEDIVAIDSLRKVTRCHITPVIATLTAITKAIEKHYASIRRSEEVTELLSGMEFVVPEGVEEKELDLGKLKEEIEEAPVVKVVNMVLTEAGDRVTDIHVEPTGDEVVIRYRIDGVLKEIMRVPKKLHEGIISRLKIMAKLNIAERRLPQDGRFTVRLPEREVDVRVSAVPTIFGEKIVLRLLDKSEFAWDLHNLGFEPEMLDIFHRSIKLPYGMIIASGPTGCGKSTTLHAALSEIKSVEDNIVTVEEPVEYQVNGINQISTNPKIGLTFTHTLRHILRQDPDKIMIGEIRDKETADIKHKV